MKRVSDIEFQRRRRDAGENNRFEIKSNNTIQDVTGDSNRRIKKSFMRSSVVSNTERQRAVKLEVSDFHTLETRNIDRLFHSYSYNK